MENKKFWVWDTKYFEYKQYHMKAQNGFFNGTLEDWDSIKQHHFKFIKKNAAKGYKLLPTTKRNFNLSFLLYLNVILNCDLPIPEFFVDKQNIIQNSAIEFEDYENSGYATRRETEEKDTKEVYRLIQYTKMVKYEKEHNKLQNLIYNKLKKKYGKKNVSMERNFIDIRVEYEDKVEFIEVKCDTSATRCIRPALGQIIEYAFKDDTQKKKEITIFGNRKPNNEEKDYISHLQRMIPSLNFTYCHSLNQIK
jgi:hypothetical protein